MLAGQSAQGIGKPGTEIPQNQKTGDQQAGGGEVLAAHDLPLFARLLAAIGGCFVRFVAKFFGGHGEGLVLVARETAHLSSLRTLMSVSRERRWLRTSLAAGVPIWPRAQAEEGVVVEIEQTDEVDG